MAPFGMGQTYSQAAILAACNVRGLTARSTDEHEVVHLLDRGCIVGLFSGSAESGRRALGHRSIIADPRERRIKDKINDEIKHRQWFRPLAPMVLAERVGQWFDCPDDFQSPYMSFAIPVKPGLETRVPAIVHIDGTARVQTVHRELSPRVHQLLSRWHELTGVPMLVNTSFNDREPIVETPADALETFLRIGMDAVYFLDCHMLVSKAN
jgi:carbamoyltransferase